MKSVFDRSTKDELKGRINQLNPSSASLWGKMTLFQMLRHCKLWDDMTQGTIHCKRVFFGRIIGKMALKSVLKDESPLRKSTPTSEELVVTEKNGDIASAKADWQRTLDLYSEFNNPEFVHPFFGKMTKEQVGQFVYKHANHHLAQFGV